MNNDKPIVWTSNPKKLKRLNSAHKCARNKITQNKKCKNKNEAVFEQSGLSDYDDGD
jgi:hypothetical protein